jgi:ubiquinone/menaquinone biosynthesis C-methylase UbiE
VNVERALGRRLARAATNAVVRSPALWRVFGPLVRTQFERLAPYWDTMRTAQSFAPFTAALESLDPPRRVLDLGTGTGEAAFLVARRFPEAEVLGVDLADAMVGEARRKTPRELGERVRFERVDASRLPYDDGAFDLVTLANMIPFFDELARVVAPGGAALFAFSLGSETPIYVAPTRLRRELARRGFTEFADFSAGAGTAVVARKV